MGVSEAWPFHLSPHVGSAAYWEAMINRVNASCAAAWRWAYVSGIADPRIVEIIGHAGSTRPSSTWSTRASTCATCR
jgi:hypothetical protein